MKYSILIFCVLICMSIIPNKVKGIQCYDCDDLTGENCKNVNDNMIKNCSSLISTCIKTIAKDSDMEYIHRGCGPVIKIIDNDCRDQKVGNYDGTYCECDTDLCNGNKQEEEEEERPEKSLSPFLNILKNIYKKIFLTIKVFQFILNCECFSY
ncbi:hypothetical protein PVAND_012485 [Polypedilum vanderplanki]|uniref:Protein quiver n=1 Tax=Polypedilum vanderplanki TaxID=319348 RepID=A0A9J6CMK6_POLVA|nr:hypothetical protein PVAND_012485 [Polypedilum vanderplanki]